MFLDKHNKQYFLFIHNLFVNKIKRKHLGEVFFLINICTKTLYNKLSYKLQTYTISFLERGILNPN